MAYRQNELSVLAYANGFTQWHYRTDDSLAKVRGIGYFANASGMLRVNDAILVNAGDGNGLVWHQR